MQKRRPKRVPHLKSEKKKLFDRPSLQNDPALVKKRIHRISRVFGLSSRDRATAVDLFLRFILCSPGLPQFICTAFSKSFGSSISVLFKSFAHLARAKTRGRHS